MWDMKSTIELIRSLSLADNGEDLMAAFARHLRRTMRVSLVVVVDRRDRISRGYRVVKVGSWDDRTGQFIDSSGPRIFLGGILCEILDAGEMKCIHDLSLARDDPMSDLFGDKNTLVSFPIYDKGETVGAVVLLSDEFLECGMDELCGLGMMSGLMDKALKAQAMTRKVEETCVALDRELSAAAEVQQWLLPSTFPDMPWFSMAASYKAARHSGGDYFDARRLSDRQLGVLIADVSGKGAPAAVLVAVLRTLVQTYGLLWNNPSALLGKLNEKMCELQLQSHSCFVTVFCAVLDGETGLCSYSSAGHNPPRLYKTHLHRIVGVDDARSIPLGISDSAIYANAHLDLSPGDVLLMYTDGVIDALSNTKMRLGVEGLDMAFSHLIENSEPKTIIHRIHSAINEFSMSGVIDDQTLLAVKVI